MNIRNNQQMTPRDSCLKRLRFPHLHEAYGRTLVLPRLHGRLFYEERCGSATILDMDSTY